MNRTAKHQSGRHRRVGPVGMTAAVIGTFAAVIGAITVATRRTRA